MSSCIRVAFLSLISVSIGAPLNRWSGELIVQTSGVDVRRYLRVRAAGALQDLQAFVRIPSVSAQARHDRDVRAAADWLATRLRRAGLPQVSVVRTARHPLVLAAWRDAPGRPTVLVYGHYDVQPVDPLGEWRSPPFAAEVRGPELFGRGASDDKGQLLCHVEAIEALLRSRGRLPVNVICLFEGEEEIGSPSLRSSCIATSATSSPMSPSPPTPGCSALTAQP
jgi:acetylornithine deacetylase/succinyl-diaminopimelate desuccinylase-like protein